MLEKGLNVNTADEDGYTLLASASANGHVEVVRLLLEKGANVNAVDRERWTPLSWALRNSYGEVVKLLLEVGKAKVDLGGMWMGTPLWYARKYENEAIVKLLRQYFY